MYPNSSANISKSAQGNSALKTPKSGTRWSYRVKDSTGGAILPISQSRIIYEELGEAGDGVFAKEDASAASDTVVETVITASGANRESDIELGDLGKDAIRVRQDWFVVNEQSSKPSSENSPAYPGGVGSR